MKSFQNESIVIAATVFLCASAFAVGCGAEADDADGTTNNQTNNASNNDTNNATNNATNNDTNNGVAGSGLDTSFILADALAQPIETVDCELTNGETTSCYHIVLEGAPQDHPVGPFCPRSTDDGADAGGSWIEGGEVHDLDGAFILGLAEFYGDANWKLYEDDGSVRVTDTQEACEAAARPNVDPEYQNHCVECDLSYVDGGVETEFYIPVRPVPRDTALEIGTASKVGLSLSGVHFDLPAPVDAILSAYTIAAFDDCGGHINTVVGYHYHGARGCSEEIAQADGHAPLIGYAMDGYPIFAMLDEEGEEAGELDECRGQTDDVRGYHYHAASAGENMFIGCFRGEIVGSADAGGGMMGGGVEALSCDDPNAGPRCCGDDICDGPETAANCPVDCE